MKQKKLGSGSFACVHLTLKSTSIGSQIRFVKEAKILNSVNHRSISNFLVQSAFYKF